MPDEKHANGPFNGSSLSSLSGATPRAKILVEVSFPASSFVEVNDQIARLQRTGQLTLNFHRGKAMDMKWTNTKEVSPPDV